MELRQLRYFLATAEKLSFSEAARSLYISQSTLSQQIQTLENELGATLLRRSSHSVQLTEAGERLLPLAEITVRDGEACKTAICDLKTGLSGSLSIGVTHTCSGLLSAPLREFIRLYPKVEVQLHYTNSQSIRDLLLQRQVDFALSIRPEQLPDNVIYEDLFSDRLCLICSRTHALAQQKATSLAEVGRYALALPSRDLYGRKAIDNLLGKAGMCLKPRLEVNAPDRLFDMVEHSQLVTIYAGVTARDRAGLVSIPIEGCTTPLIGSVHQLAGHYTKRSAEVLISMLRTQAKLMELTNV